ncbi:MAG: autotransporter outer membrane beta-barrel domain-containing protein, partial [Pseudomonas sp.]
KSLVSGSARTQAGSRADLNLHDTSLWQLSGTSNLSNLRNDASLIDFSAPVGNSYKTLTVNNYHGANGTIALNTHLYDDNSPSDKLVIDGGQASGSSNLAIKNAGGAGALTQGNGIMVVDALNGGSTDQEAFRLLNRVKAGPYEYNLYRGSRDDSNSEAWYLRSSQEEPDDPELPPKKPDDPDQPEKPEQPDKPNKPINPVQPEQPEKPTHPEQPEQPEKPARIAKPNKPLIPNYRRETSLYSAIPEMALRYSHAMLDTLHERVGEERRLNVEPLPSEAIDEYGPSLGWGRVIYQNGESASADYDINAFQVGLDLYRNEDSDGSQDLAGLSLGIGQLDGSVVHGNGQDAGDNALRAYSLGGYWTHFGPAGWYVDGVLQFHAFDIDAHSVDGESLHSDGRGFSASLETGYPFEIDDDLYVEPQAQVVVSRIELDSAHDSAAEVHFEDVDSLAGRLGVRIAQDWFREDDNGDIQRTNVWVRPSIWHEFRGQPQTEFSSADGYLPFAGDLQGTSGELNLGVDYQVDENTTFTFSAGYQEGFDDDSSSYEGILGVKIKF